MFRIIRENVPQPCLWMLCDESSCGAVLQMAVDAKNPEDAQVAGFVQQALKAGWKVGLDRQQCTLHAAGKKAEQPLVLLANGRMQFPAMHFKG